jgi:hypothetical protein
MDTQSVIEYFGGRKGLYKALKLGGYQAIGAWGERPPMGRQWQIELLTNGHLRADDFETRRLVTSPQSPPIRVLKHPPIPRGKRKAAQAQQAATAIPDDVTAIAGE